MIIVLIICFIPLVIFVSVTFLVAMGKEYQRADSENMTFINHLGVQIENITQKTYNTSDAYATNALLLEKINKDYEKNSLMKKYEIIQIESKIFSTYNMLNEQRPINAIYHIEHDAIFNLLDPNRDEDIVLDELDRLDVTNKDHFGKFIWYPVQENFLQTAKYNNVRRDRVVVGSRQIFTITNNYAYVHIFTLEEGVFYDMYKDTPQALQGDIYILNEKDELVSASNVDYVEAGRLPIEIKKMTEQLVVGTNKVIRQGTKHHVYMSVSENDGWKIIMDIPADAITQNLSMLYRMMLLGFFACFIACGIGVFALHRKFMKPFIKLYQSMGQVDGGKLDDRVEPTGHKEIKKMMQNYNTMLDRIQKDVEEKIELEQTKQDLEMEVLTNQINPHFLYNTLETIVWKSYEAGVPKIGKIATSLGKLYRLSIQGGKVIPLSQLKHIEAYMNIQQSRYEEKLGYEVRLHGCKVENQYILKLILQPIVENAILHGINGLERPLGIRIHVYHHEDVLRIRIVDNEIGRASCRERVCQYV